MKIICIGRNFADHAKELGNDKDWSTSSLELINNHNDNQSEGEEMKKNVERRSSQGEKLISVLDEGQGVGKKSDNSVLDDKNLLDSSTSRIGGAGDEDD